MARKFLPRLSKADVAALFSAHQFCDQAINLLRTTNAQAAAAAIPLIGNADSTICALWNKTERALLGRAAVESTEKHQDASGEHSPGTDIDQGGKTPPDEPGS